MQNNSLSPNPGTTPVPGNTPAANPGSGAAAPQIPEGATIPGGTPSMVEPAPSATPAFGPAAPGSNPVAQTTPLTSPNPGPVAPVKKSHHVLEIVVLVVVSLIAVTFIGLFIWKYSEWDTLKTDSDSRTDAAVAVAIADTTTKLENEFVEREKYPYKTFAGPADYGSLGFEYPKTWNLYIARDAARSGDYEAYLNPGEVLPVGSSTINALRVTIENKAFDTIAKSYEGAVKNGKLSMVTRNVGSAVANVYTGELSSNIRGIAAVFKLRDKTVILQTDAELFSDEFYKLLDTVTFVE